MSASCSNQHAGSDEGDPHARLGTITLRLPLAEKQRFRSLATAHGMSEARLTLLALRTLMHEDAPPPVVPTRGVERASERITIRLRPGDRQAIRRRASQRRMKDAGYLAALVRAHVVANPPLPTAELQELKQAVAALVRGIAELSADLRELSRTPGFVDTLWKDLRRTRAQVIELERQFHAYAKAAVIAWEAPHA